MVNKKYDTLEERDNAKKQRDKQRQKGLPTVRFAGQKLVERWNFVQSQLGMETPAKLASYLLDL